MAEHSPARILQVRAKLYDLLTHCIPPTTILKVQYLLSGSCDRKIINGKVLDSDIQADTAH